MITQLNLLRELVDFGVQLVSYRQASVPLLALTLQAFIVEEIWVNQENNLQAQRIKQNLEREKSLGFVVHENGTLRFQNRLYVPRNEELKKQILEETHNTRYSVHPGGTKM